MQFIWKIPLHLVGNMLQHVDLSKKSRNYPSILQSMGSQQISPKVKIDQRGLCDLVQPTTFNFLLDDKDHGDMVHGAFGCVLNSVCLFMCQGFSKCMASIATHDHRRASINQVPSRQDNGHEHCKALA